MTTLTTINDEIEQLSDERTALWNRLSGGLDPDVKSEIKQIDERLSELLLGDRAERAQALLLGLDRRFAVAASEHAHDDRRGPGRPPPIG